MPTQKQESSIAWVGKQERNTDAEVKLSEVEKEWKKDKDFYEEALEARMN